MMCRRIWIGIILLLFIPIFYATSIEHVNPANEEDWVTFHDRIIDPILAVHLPSSLHLWNIIKTYLFHVTLRCHRGQLMCTLPSRSPPLVTNTVLLPHVLPPGVILNYYPFQCVRALRVVQPRDVDIYHTLLRDLQPSQLTVTFKVFHQNLFLPQLRLPASVRHIEIACPLFYDYINLLHHVDVSGFTRLSLRWGNIFQYENLAHLPPSITEVIFQDVEIWDRVTLAPTVTTVRLVRCRFSPRTADINYFRGVAHVEIVDCRGPGTLRFPAAVVDHHQITVSQQSALTSSIPFRIIIDRSEWVLQKYHESLRVEWTRDQPPRTQKQYTGLLKKLIDLYYYF